MSTVFGPLQVPEESPTVSGLNAPDPILNLEESTEHHASASQNKQALQPFLHQERQDAAVVTSTDSRSQTDQGSPSSSAHHCPSTTWGSQNLAKPRSPRLENEDDNGQPTLNSGDDVKRQWISSAWRSAGHPSQPQPAGHLGLQGWCLYLAAKLGKGQGMGRDAGGCKQRRSGME